MSDIIINSDNFKRFAKRLQKELKINECDKNLMESQEILSKVLGSSNTYELMKKISTTSKLEEVAEELIEIKSEVNYRKAAESFLLYLTSLISKNSEKKLAHLKECYFEISENNIILTFVPLEALKNKYSFYFGEKSDDYKIYSELLHVGFCLTSTP